MTARPDISLVLTLHREGPLVHRTLRSLAEADRYARRFGVRTELVAVLDRADAATRAALAGFAPDAFEAMRVIEVDNGSLGPSRNDGIAAASGEFVAICDGDDLVSFNMLADMLRCARAAPPRCLHFPEWLMAFGARAHVVRYHPLERVTPLAFLQLHPYTSRAFARREAFLETPYRDLRVTTGYAYEDWDFNAACVARGHDIRVACDTVLFYRQRAGSLLRQAVTLSVDQIPPNPLHEPATILRLGREAHGRTGALPWAFRHADHAARPADLDRPVLRALIRAANAIDPEVDIAALRGCGAFLGNVTERAIAAGRAWFEACEALAGEAPFDDVFLLPFAGTGGAELYFANLLEALAEAFPRRRRLVLFGETPPDGGGLAPRLPATVTLDIGRRWPDLPMADRSLIALRLVEARAPRARLHLRDSAFACDFFRAYRAVLGSHQTWFYRFSDATLRDDGDLFVQATGFTFVSEHIPGLARVVTDTERLAARDRERIGLWPERFVCLPGRRAPATDAAAIAAASRVTRHRVLWASRLDPEKRPELVPRIADRLAARDSALRIEMHGRAVLGAFDTALLEGRPNLAWHGGYAAFGELDAAAHDAFIYTSWYDGMPNAVMEAIAAGLPVIAPDVGGIGEIVEDGVSGILLPPIADEDAAAEAYAEAILRLVGDPALRCRLATEALRRLEQRHAPAAHVAHVAALYGREGDAA